MKQPRIVKKVDPIKLIAAGWLLFVAIVAIIWAGIVHGFSEVLINIAATVGVIALGLSVLAALAFLFMDDDDHYGY